MERKAKKRKRRTAEQARDEILTLAERHLIVGGFGAVRIATIAEEMGVTHPAILKHFASREALLQAVVRRAARRLRQALADAVAQRSGGEPDVAALFTALDALYRDQGYARLSAWLLLAGLIPSGSGLFREAGETLHRARPRRRGHTPPLDDTLFVLVLVNLVAWSDSLTGNGFRRAVGLPADAATTERFREWFADLVRAHLDVDRL
jgi:AcrR family transcriptional regulator